MRRTAYNIFTQSASAGQNACIIIKLYDIMQPDYARTAWPTRCQLLTKKAASALHPLLHRLSAFR
jgi:hypothetical protein